MNFLIFFFSGGRGWGTGSHVVLAGLKLTIQSGVPGLQTEAPRPVSTVLGTMHMASGMPGKHLPNELHTQPPNLEFLGNSDLNY